MTTIECPSCGVESEDLHMCIGLGGCGEEIHTCESCGLVFSGEHWSALDCNETGHHVTMCRSCFREMPWRGPAVIGPEWIEFPDGSACSKHSSTRVVQEGEAIRLEFEWRVRGHATSLARRWVAEQDAAIKRSMRELRREEDRRCEITS